MVVAMAWPSREDAHTTHRSTRRAAALADSPSEVTLPDTYGGNLAALQRCQRLDGGRFIIKKTKL